MNTSFIENKVEEALQLLAAQLEHAERQSQLIEDLNHRIANLETELALINHISAVRDDPSKKITIV